MDVDTQDKMGRGFEVWGGQIYFCRTVTGLFAFVPVHQAAWLRDRHTDVHVFLLTPSPRLQPGQAVQPSLSRGLKTHFFLNKLRVPFPTFLSPLSTFWTAFLFLRILFLFFLLFVHFFFLPALILSSQFHRFPSIHPFPSILLPSSISLHHALLSYCDSPALWTACLPSNRFLLPQHCSGNSVSPSACMSIVWLVLFSESVTCNIC